jgi:hypothetical protein
MCEDLLNDFLVEMAIEKDFDGAAMMPTLLHFAKQVNRVQCPRLHPAPCKFGWKPLSVHQCSVRSWA